MCTFMLTDREYLLEFFLELFCTLQKRARVTLATGFDQKLELLGS